MPGVVLQRVDSMRTTVVLDDQLLEQAQRMTGLTGRTALLRAGLRALIELESARRLARLGGTEPKLEEIPRRRGKSA
jgi:Arc/MetJ family transcription regulator